MAYQRMLGWPFQEGDDLHPPANVAKMRSGRPLDDRDRLPWLQAVARWIDGQLAAHQPGIITCSNLKRAYLLIDARHGLKDVDTEALDAFDVAAVSYQIVLTKADKLKPAEVDAVVARTLAAVAKRPAAYPRVLATSSEKGTGIPELRAEIVAACAV